MLPAGGVGKRWLQSYLLSSAGSRRRRVKTQFSAPAFNDYIGFGTIYVFALLVSGFGPFYPFEIIAIVRQAGR